MILIVENENGTKQRIVVPDNAREMTEEDVAYFNQKAEEELKKRNRNEQIYALSGEIADVHNQIFDLKNKLSKSDYKLFKVMDGEMTEEEYSPTKAERATWRAKINELEALIATKEASIVALKEV